VVPVRKDPWLKFLPSVFPTFALRPLSIREIRDIRGQNSAPFPVACKKIPVPSAVKILSVRIRVGCGSNLPSSQFLPSAFQNVSFSAFSSPLFNYFPFSPNHFQTKCK